MANRPRLGGLRVADQCDDGRVFNSPGVQAPSVDYARKWFIRHAIISVNGVVEYHVRPRFASEPELVVQAWVLPSITSDMPRTSLPTDIRDRFSSLTLANPQFHVTRPVDMLLGADVFSVILDGRKVKIDESLPTAFSSIFGWVLIGPLPAELTCHLTTPMSLSTSIEDMMGKFWTVEEPDTTPSSFTDEGWCETQFRAEHSRLPSGRFQVPLPIRKPVPQLNFPGSRSIVLRRFESLERKLSANTTLRDAYRDFMSEYLSLGHMSVAATPGRYIIPHHAVCQQSNGDLKIGT